jgi:glycosyltransferase involved in cell wall biosynthesis
MRLLCISHYGALFGANRSLLHLLDRLRTQHGVEVLVFAPREGAFTAALRHKGIPYKVFSYANGGYSLFSWRLWLFPLVWLWSRALVLPKATEAARAFDPDIIHSNSLLVALGWQLAETLQKPHIWHLREFGWRDYRIVFPQGRAFLLKKLNAAAAVVCISEAIGQAHTRGLDKPPHVLFNGIGTRKMIEKNQAAGQQKSADRLFRFLVIGMLHPAKGQLEALRAFAVVYREFPQARLVVVGEGQRIYTWRLHHEAEKSGVTAAVDFRGYVADPGDAYAQADAVLMCSPNEAMGRVTAEAMSYGKPVIAYDGGATPELITHQKEGLLYKSALGLSEAMKQVMLDPESAAKMGQRGYQRALSAFSDERYGEAFYTILEDSLRFMN